MKAIGETIIENRDRRKWMKLEIRAIENKDSWQLRQLKINTFENKDY